jgi:hypothetical protein
MRMWNVPSGELCNKHLLGEHVEMHMFIGSLRLGKSVQGFIDDGLVEIHNIYHRHAELVLEMELRGMKHKSPLSAHEPDAVELYRAGSVDVGRSRRDLQKRCKNCRIHRGV